MNEEIILDKLRKMLFTIQQANECGLSNNDFKEDIQILSGAIGLIENLIQRNKDLEQIEKEHQEENGSHKHTIKIESQVIPTSKLFKKIEKKIKLFRKMGFNEAYSALIDLYEELLEESDK